MVEVARIGKMEKGSEQVVKMDTGSLPNGTYLQKFKLYETLSNFYMIGWDKSRTAWKVLKISRLDQSELNVTEDSTTYSEIECYDLLKRINEGNKSTGGLRFVNACYGIIGFVRFLGPYYMLIITKRRKIGTIYGHAIYAVAKSEMIPIPDSSFQTNPAYNKNENRYKKLLRSVDLTKDFFFSYSYHIMLSLQRNIRNHETDPVLYESMSVWNEFLTRGIRNQLKNAVWTVALVHGFFKQVKLSISGRDFDFILIARRSRHYAGTRYLKRGVNEKGRVANDVETEQIVVEDVPEGGPVQISSIVQHRGSIPLFWSQETSRLNIKPDIILSSKDHNYDATRLHFQNLVKRYGNPIIILDLIKTREKKPRESILRAEFAYAIEVINKNLGESDRLKFLHWDLNKYARNNPANVLAYLGKIAANALDLTGFFHCQLIPSSSKLRISNSMNSDFVEKNLNDEAEKVENPVDEDETSDGYEFDGGHYVKPLAFQTGVLRTNCIDCLDRTNVAQYSYGLVALGHQLKALGYIDVPNIDSDSSLADDLMKIYEEMGDTLALQYGGSTAHNKIFSARRGQWKAATQSQELFRTLQRYYSNAYMDAEKQDAINLFLGHFQPQPGKPALWELDTDQHYSIGRRDSGLGDANSRSKIKRSLSDGNILSGSPNDDADAEQKESSCKALPVKMGDCNMSLVESTPEISSCGSGVSCSRYTPSMPSRRLFPDVQEDQCLENDRISFYKHGDWFNSSNFLDVDWLSSSGNSCEEETYDRSMLIGSPSAGQSSGELTSSSATESGSSLKGKEQSGDLTSLGMYSSGTLSRYSEKFVNWVNGDMLLP